MQLSDELIHLLLLCQLEEDPLTVGSLSETITEARDTLLVSLHKPVKLLGDVFFIDLIDPLDKAGENPTQRPAWMSIDDFPIELTCLAMVLDSIGVIVLEELAPLWDFQS
jgi:hypothetical protein